MHVPTECTELIGCGVVQGDWGTQFGMLIQHIAETRPGGLQGTTTEEVADLQALYKASKKRFDDEEDFKARAREAVTRLQSGDPEFLEAGTFSLRCISMPSALRFCSPV
jgi:arginyl-tRNA synthetase